MDDKKRLELQEAYKKLSDDELAEMLTIDKDEYEDGIYQLLENEAERRKLDERAVTEKLKSKKFEHNFASSGKRFLNFIIDMLTCYCVYFVLVIVLMAMGIIAEGAPEDAGVWTVVWILSVVAYYYICEVKFQRTLGKLITKTKVLTIDGEKLNAPKVLGRTLSRFVPFEIISGFFSNYEVWYGWHDSWSGTVVVRSDYPQKEQKSEKANIMAKQSPGLSQKKRRRYKHCPFCNERIYKEAIKCQYCKEFLEKPNKK